MRKSLIFLGTLMSIFLMSGIASAASYSYEYTNTYSTTVNIQTSGNPVWVQMNFPKASGTYTNGVFEYDTYYSQGSTLVDQLKITLNGSNVDDPNNAYPIDMWLSFTTNHLDKKEIGGAALPTSSSAFTLAADIKNGKLYYDGTTSEGNLSNVTLGSFVGMNSFYIGYDCHFQLNSTVVDVTVHDNGKVPEPATILLVGCGLLGIVGLRRKLEK